MRQGKRAYREQRDISKSLKADFVGYEVLIEFIRARGLQYVEGDLVEIGAFMGGGTAKLAKFAHRYGKRVFAVDIFDPGCDRTRDISGNAMGDIYRALLRGRSQFEVYEENTRGLANIVTIKGDSNDIDFTRGQRFIFGFIDGNHRPDYVRNDFDIVWPCLVPGGVLALHDYGGELPQVTGTIDALADEHSSQIDGTYYIKDRDIIMLVKAKAT
ncbi:class I SAM-dependent methyltransferase [Chloroflexota bacterium]